MDLSRLQTEAINARTAQIDSLSALEICRLINEEDASVARAVETCIPVIADAITAVAPRVQKGGRVLYVGAGTSGRYEHSLFEFLISISIMSLGCSEDWPACCQLAAISYGVLRASCLKSGAFRTQVEKAMS